MGESSPYQYTYKDIERYHAGQMSPEEMHRMEMAALDDPFLADALEGYTYTSTPKSDLEKLNERLNERTNRKARVIWISKKYNTLKVAAVLIFVIAGSWLLVVSKQKPASDLALEKKAEPKINNETSKARIDSGLINKNADSLNEANKDLASTNNFSEHKKKFKYHYNKQNDKNSVAIVTSKPNSQNSQPALEAPAKDNASAVQITPTARMSRFKSETNQYQDSTDKIAGYANANKLPADTIKNVNVVLKPQAVPNLSEVVVTKAKTNRKLSRSAFAVKDTLEPEEGWDEYNDYIANHIKSPEEARAKNISGEVQLSFDVNHDGRPVNIRVEKSLCDQCDNEAIRLLKEGPNWKKKKNKKGKLRIHF